MPEPAPLSLALRTFAGLHALPGGLDADAIDLQVTEDDALESGAVHGWADHAGSIEIVHHPKAPPIRVLVTLLHEVVHMVLPEDEHHGALFRATFAAAAEEAWGLDLGDELDADGPGEGYDTLQGVIEYRLRERALGLRLRLWWVRVRRWVGLLDALEGLDVGLSDHLLLLGLESASG
ncbi:MAG: hypothetical protein ABIO70_26030 [Pseudomonadota bacterium]